MFGKNKKKDESKKEHKPCLDCQLKIAEANERAVSSEDGLLRVAAEFENYKKRQQREMDMYKKITIQTILLDFLPLVDQIDSAILMATESVAQGLKMIRSRLLMKLAKHGVEPIEALNQRFDPNYHEAVMVVERDGIKEDVVGVVLETGYVLDGFLLKPAKVVVHKKPTEEKTNE